MTPVTACKVVPAVRPDNPRRFHSSECWLPACVARRLLRAHSPAVVGRRVLVQRDRQLTGGRRNHPRWIYWDCVLIEIERRTSFIFREHTMRAYAAQSAAHASGAA